MKSRYDDQIHGAYYPPSPTHGVPRRYDSIVRHARRFLGGRSAVVLEVGSEQPQNVLYWIGKLGLRQSQVALIEISTEAVELLARLDLKALQLDVSTSPLPFEDDSVDLVIFSEVLEHLLNPDHTLEEIRRVLRPGGGLILTTPNLAGWANRIQLALGFQPIGTETGVEWVFGRGPLVPRSRPVGHLQLFTLRALTEILTFHRLSLVKVQGLPYSDQIGPARKLRFIDTFFAGFPAVASSLLVVAEKEGLPGQDRHGTA